MRLWINPDEVQFDTTILEHVRSVRLRRISVPDVTLVQSLWGTGPRGGGNFQGVNPVAGEQVSIDVVRDVVAGLTLDLTAGSTGVLSFEVASGRSDAHRRTLTYDVKLAEIDARLVRDDRGIETLRFVQDQGA